MCQLPVVAFGSCRLTIMLSSAHSFAQPNLLSASRAFVTKVDVVEKSGKLCGNGRHLSLFIFSDVLEVRPQPARSLTSDLPLHAHRRLAALLPIQSGMWIHSIVIFRSSNDEPVIRRSLPARALQQALQP